MGQSKYENSFAIPGEAAPRRPRSEISATALAMEGYPGVAPLRPPPGAKLANVADLPFHNFEPAPELLKSPSGHNYLGGKILQLLKLKKKPSTTTTHFLAMPEFHPTSVQTVHFQDIITHSTQFPTPMTEDVRKRFNDDSEEHSSDNCSSSASIASSSRNSSSSAQSFDSNRSSGTTSRSSFLCSGQQLSNTQIMAHILMSIMHEKDNNEELPESSEDEHQLNGPHESAWHQPARDEINCADSPTVFGGRRSSASSKLNGPHESAWHEPRDEMFVDSPRGRHSSASKHSSGRHTPKVGGRYSVDGRLTSPGPSRRFGKLDLSRVDVHKLW